MAKSSQCRSAACSQPRCDRVTRPIIIDSSLLVLLVVGAAGKELIAGHKRLRHFSTSDFDLLPSILRRYSPVIATPNVWTETSNLARQISEPARTKVGGVMRGIMNRAQEAYIASAEAGAAEEFLRLGLADCALLEVKPTLAPILTADLDLYLAAWKRGRTAINFNHFREVAT